MALKTHYSENNLIEIGVDECGRGPIFGRMYFGACIWPNDIENNLIKDSKKYSRTSNSIEKAYDFIIDNCISYGISYCEPEEIDKYGLASCLKTCMKEAVEDVSIYPDIILIDGEHGNVLLDNIDIRGTY